MFKSESGKMIARKAASSDYASWLDLAHYELNSQKGLPDKCYWRADVKIPASGTSADLDNLGKGIFDALHKSGKTPDDRYLVDFRFRWCLGDTVSIVIAEEDAEVWGPIKGASLGLIAKLSQKSLFGENQ